jgi:sulfur relay (sulfurtransferase) complex TusBCD TusD component (DsrE family)
MKKPSLITLLFICIAVSGFSQDIPVSLTAVAPETLAGTRIGIIISSNDAETVWNAFRFANFASLEGDSVSVFLLGKGVESADIGTEEFNVKEMMEVFKGNGGTIYACGTCLRSRNSEGSELCPLSTMADMYEIVKRSEKILTF